MLKNVSGQKIRVFAFDRSTAEPRLLDAANITCKVSINGGAAVALADTNPVETEDGYYLFDVTQAETNGDTLDFYPESSTSGVQVLVAHHDRQTVSSFFGTSSASYGSIAGVEVFTLHDLAFRLALRTSSSTTPRMNALHVRAIQDAIRGLPSKHDWNYFRRQDRIVTSPAVTLDVVYDHTGGSSERLLTTTDTFPTDATYGEIRIGRHIYRVDKRLSATQATLEPNFSLTEDFDGECTWERRAYTFSRTFAKIHYAQNITLNTPLTFLSSAEFMSGSYNGWGYGPTSHFTYQNHGGSFGESELILLPSPSIAEMIEISGTVTPLIPSVAEVSGSGAVVTSGSTSVTVSSANFTSKLIGCIFRLGRDEVQPINMESSNWEFQAFVTDVPTATTLTLSEASPITATRGYCISSPVDAESSSMLEYIEDEAYHQYTKNHNHQNFMVARKIASESLRMAVARDNKTSLNSYLRTGNGMLGYLSGRFYTPDPNPSSD